MSQRNQKPGLSLPPDLARLKNQEEAYKKAQEQMIQQVRVQASVHFMGEQINRLTRITDLTGEDITDPTQELDVERYKANCYRAGVLAIIAADTLIEHLFGITIKYRQEEGEEQQEPENPIETP